MRKSLECPSSPGFPGIPGKARKARRKFSILSGLFLKCKNDQSFWQEGFQYSLALPWFRGFLEGLESQEKMFHAFRSFSYVQKAWIELLTRMISSTLGSSLILGFPGKAKRKYSMPSRLFPFKKAWNPCRLFKTWWSFHLILGFPRKPRKAWKAKKKFSKLSRIFLYMSKILEISDLQWFLAVMALPHLEKPGKLS